MSAAGKRTRSALPADAYSPVIVRMAAAPRPNAADACRGEQKMRGRILR